VVYLSKQPEICSGLPEKLLEKTRSSGKYVRFESSGTTHKQNPKVLIKYFRVSEEGKANGNIQTSCPQIMKRLSQSICGKHRKLGRKN
jgi:hypothetical protein